MPLVKPEPCQLISCSAGSTDAGSLRPCAANVSRPPFAFVFMALDSLLQHPVTTEQAKLQHLQPPRSRRAAHPFAFAARS